jgi:superoxide dismutase
VLAFWEIVNWPDVADRFAKARTLDLALAGS